MKCALCAGNFDLVYTYLALNVRLNPTFQGQNTPPDPHWYFICQTCRRKPIWGCFKPSPPEDNPSYDFTPDYSCVVALPDGAPGLQLSTFFDVMRCGLQKDLPPPTHPCPNVVRYQISHPETADVIFVCEDCSKIYSKPPFKRLGRPDITFWYFRPRLFGVDGRASGAGLGSAAGAVAGPPAGAAVSTAGAGGSAAGAGGIIPVGAGSSAGGAGVGSAAAVAAPAHQPAVRTARVYCVLTIPNLEGEPVDMPVVSAVGDGDCLCHSLLAMLIWRPRLVRRIQAIAKRHRVETICGTHNVGALRAAAAEQFAADFNGPWGEHRDAPGSATMRENLITNIFMEHPGFPVRYTLTHADRAQGFILNRPFTLANVVEFMRTPQWWELEHIFNLFVGALCRFLEIRIGIANVLTGRLEYRDSEEVDFILYRLENMHYYFPTDACGVAYITAYDPHTRGDRWVGLCRGTMGPDEAVEIGPFVDAGSGTGSSSGAVVPSGGGAGSSSGAVAPASSIGVSQLPAVQSTWTNSLVMVIDASSSMEQFRTSVLNAVQPLIYSYSNCSTTQLADQGFVLFIAFNGLPPQPPGLRPTRSTRPSSSQTQRRVTDEVVNPLIEQHGLSNTGFVSDRDTYRTIFDINIFQFLFAPFNPSHPEAAYTHNWRSMANYTPRDQTPLFKAFLFGLKQSVALWKAAPQKAVYLRLLTDGEDNVPPNESERIELASLIRTAAQLSIHILVIIYVRPTANNDVLGAILNTPGSSIRRHKTNFASGFSRTRLTFLDTPHSQPVSHYPSYSSHPAGHFTPPPQVVQRMSLRDLYTLHSTSKRFPGTGGSFMIELCTQTTDPVAVRELSIALAPETSNLGET